METFCTCTHQSSEHRGRTGACRALDSYGIPCSCPSLEPDPNSVELSIDAEREKAIIAGDPVPPR